jgi:hypothetical protein
MLFEDENCFETFLSDAEFYKIDPWPSLDVFWKVWMKRCASSFVLQFILDSSEVGSGVGFGVGSEIGSEVCSEKIFGWL